MTRNRRSLDRLTRLLDRLLAARPPLAFGSDRRRRRRSCRVERLEDRALLTSPMLLSVSPGPHAASASVDSDVSAAFDQAIDPASANDRTFVVHGSQTGRRLVPPNALSVNGTIKLQTVGNFRAGELVQAVVTDRLTNAAGEGTPRFLWQFRVAAPAGTGLYVDVDEPGVTGISSSSVGDLDGDGDLDAVAPGSPDAAAVWINQGGFDFVRAQDLPSDNELEDPQSRGFTSSQLADFDGDGDLDAVTSGEGTAGVRIWLNDGTGRMSAGQELFDVLVGSISIGDFDSDGDIDVARGISGEFSVWQNDGSASFVKGPVSDLTVDGSFPSAVVFGDADNDGDLDAIASGNHGVFLNDGTGSFTLHATLPELPDARTRFAPGDVNGDGNLDLFSFKPQHSLGGSFIFSVFIGNGHGDFTREWQQVTSAQSTSLNLADGIALGDLDADGDLDAAVAGVLLFNEGEVFLWRQSRVSDNNITRLVADVDGDGALDLFDGTRFRAGVAVDSDSTTVIEGRAFHDRNGNAQQDEGEPGVDGWSVVLRDDQNNILSTDETGTVDRNGDGIITPDAETGWYQLVSIGDRPVQVSTSLQGIQAGWFETTGSDSLGRLARAVDDRFQLGSTGNMFINWAGLEEKWLAGRDEFTGRFRWFYITPDGSLFSWQPSVLNPLGSLRIASLSPIHYDNPRLLYNPRPPVDTTADTRTTLRADFGYVQLTAIEGRKFEDLNGNSRRDAGEPYLNGWTIELRVDDGTVIARTVTADRDLNDDGTIDPETERGWYRFDGLVPGQFGVSEVARPGWRSASDRAAARAWELDRQFQFFIQRSTFENLAGHGEKWIRGRGSTGWFYILPGGDLYRWSGRGSFPLNLSQETLVERLGPRYHANLDLLLNARLPSLTVHPESDTPLTVDFGNMRTG